MNSLSRTLAIFIFTFFACKSFSQTNGWDRLKASLDKLDSDSAKILAYYKIASEIYRSTPQEAKEIASEGYALATKQNYEDQQIELLNLLGVIELRLNHFDESISTHFKVLHLRERRNDKQGMMSSFLNIGNVFNKSYDPEQALVYYEKALAISKEIKDVHQQANISTNIGNIHAQHALDTERKEDVVKAINYLLETVDFCKRQAPDVELYNSYILLSYLYLKNDELDKSTRYTDLAIHITEEKNIPVAICYARINRANIYVQRGQFDLAVEEVDRIKRIIKKNQLEYLTEDLGGDFEKIAQAVKERDTQLILTDKDSADRKFYEDAEVLRVKIREELREKYDTERKELENKNLLLENAAMMRESERIKLLWGMTLGILLTFIGMLFIVQRKNRQLKTEKTNLEKARDEIKEQAEQIKIQHAELVQADRFRSRIFSVVSHDLRTPIANFQTLLSMSKLMDLPAADIKNTLVSIGQEVETASKMLDELLVWSSQQMNNEKLDIQDISVYEAIEDCKRLFSDRLRLKNLTFLNEVSNMLTIRGDRKRFEFILRNILNNAIKFSFIGKTVTVAQEESDSEIIISITDEGAGMDEQKLLQLQRKDMQASHYGTLKEKGAGIGLMLCHEFAHRMGWQIRMESQPGFGSTFYICISK